MRWTTLARTEPSVTVRGLVNAHSEISLPLLAYDIERAISTPGAQSRAAALAWWLSFLLAAPISRFYARRFLPPFFACDKTPAPTTLRAVDHSLATSPQRISSVSGDGPLRRLSGPLAISVVQQPALPYRLK